LLRIAQRTALDLVRIKRQSKLRRRDACGLAPGAAVRRRQKTEVLGEKIEARQRLAVTL
jgi:hypothetical protein